MRPLPRHRARSAALVLALLAAGQLAALVWTARPTGDGGGTAGPPPPAPTPAPTTVVPAPPPDLSAPGEGPADPPGERPGPGPVPGRFPGWAAVGAIAYRPDHDSGPDGYLAQAAGELADHLNRVVPGRFRTVTTAPAGPALRLVVDPAAVPGDSPDAFTLSGGADGIRVAGETALAVRHGAYALLETLGFRWYFPHPAWTVVPAELVGPDLDGAVRSPAFDERSLVVPPGFLQATAQGPEWHRLWRARNRLDGAVDFETRHSYESFAPVDELAASHPDSVCPDSAGRPRNVRPTAPVVVARARSFADRFLARRPGRDPVAMAVPISPNDGGQSCPEWLGPDGKVDVQRVTDAVFALTNEVARHLRASHPGRYASTLSYHTYSSLPSTPLEPNVFVMVTTQLGVVGTDLTLEDRLDGFRRKGVKTGVYEYLNVWQYTHDRPYAPGKMDEKLGSLTAAARVGATVSVSEAGDNWGARGRAYWLAARLLWTPGADRQALLEDFYTHGFGPARAPVKRYFERIDAAGLSDHRAAMADLEEALRLADGTPAAERVRQLVLFTHYDWRWGAGIADDHALGVEEAEALYAELWRLTDLHLVTVKPEKAAVARLLSQRHGVGEARIKALENRSPPTPDEVRQRLAAVRRG